MKDLLFDLCVDRRHAAPAFGAIAQGDYITRWLEPTASDVDVLELARRLDRILVTEDADFGGLIFRDGLPSPPGVILAMTQAIPKDQRAQRFRVLAPSAIAAADGHFVVAGPTQCRFRPLPSYDGGAPLGSHDATS